jgi:thermostable 8-oxoguanine DNA glycosylase
MYHIEILCQSKNANLVGQCSWVGDRRRSAQIFPEDQGVLLLSAAFPPLAVAKPAYSFDPSISMLGRPWFLEESLVLVPVRAGKQLPSPRLFPDPAECVLPGVEWGRADELFTPAFWRFQALDVGTCAPANFRLGNTLEEELAACLVGGYGIPAEVGVAAFDHLRQSGVLFRADPSPELFYRVLSEPLQLGTGTVRYRFPAQKSRYLSAALQRIRDDPPQETNHVGFRNWFLQLKGVGMKTASWITRNWLQSDQVAIIDIHIFRAGLLVGLFSPSERPSASYLSMEERFLAFARAIEVRPSVLDALIWRQMRSARRLVARLLQSLSLGGC